MSRMDSIRKAAAGAAKSGLVGAGVGIGLGAGTDQDLGTTLKMGLVGAATGAGGYAGNKGMQSVQKGLHNMTASTADFTANAIKKSPAMAGSKMGPQKREAIKKMGDLRKSSKANRAAAESVGFNQVGALGGAAAAGVGSFASLSSNRPVNSDDQKLKEYAELKRQGKKDKMLREYYELKNKHQT